MRRLEGPIVVATHNKGKLAEMRELLEPFGVEAVSAGERGLPVPAETGHMYSENASLKAHAAARATGLPAIADDSGLCVLALDGAPGIFSADWATGDGGFGAAMERVRRELEIRGATDPTAWFVSALAVAWPDGEEAVFEGRVHGRVVFPPRGTAGFGYDPIFLPDGGTRTFGEIAAHEKHGIDWADPSTGLSHRARAFRKLAAALLPPPRT